MKLFNRKKKMDEREKMELYTIEHYMYWMVFWGLVISIFWQQIAMKAPFQQFAAEWIIFMIMAVGSVILEVRKGIYDEHSEPGWRSYLVYSLIFTAVFTILLLANGCRQGWYARWSDMLLAGGITAISLFVLIYGSLAVMGGLVKRRRRKLEAGLDEDSEG
ncbi:MAG: hypothetical protein KH452_09600 [Clostridiales bacterium]|nr:hypothetical protein [Clostridiales bacterium]